MGGVVFVLCITILSLVRLGGLGRGYNLAKIFMHGCF